MNFEVLLDRRKDFDRKVLKEFILKLSKENKVSEKDVSVLNQFDRAIMIALYQIDQSYLATNEFTLQKKFLRKHTFTF